MSKRIRSCRLEVKVAGSNRPTAGQLPHLAALCWPLPLPKMTYIVSQLVRKATDQGIYYCCDY